MCSSTGATTEKGGVRMSEINDVMNATMSKIKEMVDVNTIVGNPITTPDGVTLIPVSKVTFGFAAGGTDAKEASAAQKPVRFGAGSGAGVTISPVAFIVLNGSNARVLYVDPPANSTVDRIIDLVPDVIDKVKSFAE